MILLAKSNPEITLEEHINDCLKIYCLLKRCFPKVSIVANQSGKAFWATLKITIICHDLGKAHMEFQKVLKQLPNNWSFQRHELFSLPFVNALQGLGVDREHVLWVIAGHHKTFKTLSRITKGYLSDSPSHSQDVHADMLDFHQEFKLVDQSSVSTLLRDKFNIEIGPIKPRHPSRIIRSYLRTAAFNSVSAQSPELRYLLLLFGALKHCDHLGSAQVKEIESIQDSDFKFLDALEMRIQANGKMLYPHQNACYSTDKNVLLNAPTGSGKTESALLWLRRQLQVSGQGRAFYILPFTASINAMFERLSDSESGLGKSKVGMLHGKLSEYLYQYFEDFQYNIDERKEKLDTLRSKFKSLHRPLKVVTPFQLLRHIFGVKGFEQGLFECTGSYLIFDEIHAYNPSVFAQIKVLLELLTKHFHAKVVIMTATLPTYLKNELTSTIDFQEIQADEILQERFNRHKITLVPKSIQECETQIKRDLNARKKVLVVCNTIAKAQKIFRILKCYSKKSMLLHGAFNSEDRFDHEQVLLQNEQSSSTDEFINLVVGTQVIEVSLNLDFDVLYTEAAPIDALIQRCGRINRKMEKGLCPIFVCENIDPNDRYIYDPHIVRTTLTTLKELCVKDNAIVRESRLQYYIDQVYPHWTSKGFAEFQHICDLLTHSLTTMYPMTEYPINEDNFYSQFDGIKVLPASLRDRYKEYVQNFDFLGGERLKVQIRKGKFAQLRQEGRMLYKEKYVFAARSGKPISIEYWVIQAKYDTREGLLFDEQEHWQAEIN